MPGNGLPTFFFRSSERKQHHITFNCFGLFHVSLNYQLNLCKQLNWAVLGPWQVVYNDGSVAGVNVGVFVDGG